MYVCVSWTNEWMHEWMCACALARLCSATLVRPRNCERHDPTPDDHFEPAVGATATHNQRQLRSIPLTIETHQPAPWATTKYASKPTRDSLQQDNARCFDAIQRNGNTHTTVKLEKKCTELTFTAKSTARLWQSLHYSFDNKWRTAVRRAAREYFLCGPQKQTLASQFKAQQAQHLWARRTTPGSAKPQTHDSSQNSEHDPHKAPSPGVVLQGRYPENAHSWSTKEAKTRKKAINQTHHRQPCYPYSNFY